MIVIPTKDRKFNGGGFSGMMIKGVDINVSDKLGQYLIDKGFAEKNESKKNHSKKTEVKTDVTTD